MSLAQYQKSVNIENITFYEHQFAEHGCHDFVNVYRLDNDGENNMKALGDFKISYTLKIRNSHDTRIKGIGVSKIIRPP